MVSKIEYGQSYHIYNRGNNKENLFKTKEDYLQFLKYYIIFILPVADTFAWCLMKNHFHFFIQIKLQSEIGFLNPEFSASDELEKKWKLIEPNKNNNEILSKPTPVNQLKHLFSSYTKWYNSKYLRTGSLFEKNFERRLITDEDESMDLITYINNNPVKHGFVKQLTKYKWSSYYEVISGKYFISNKEYIMELFGSSEEFSSEHKRRSEKFLEFGDF